MPLPCVVLGGGVGRRMRPATDELPKPLLPVAGRPFVQHQLRWLVSEGVADVVYSVGYLGWLIQEEIERNPVPGCTVRFVDDGEILRGTGGAVRRAVDVAALPDAFYVLYGDSFIRISLPAVADAFTRSGDAALMTVLRNDGRWDKSNAVFDGSRVIRYDKEVADPRSAGMHYIDYGLSIVARNTIVERVPSDQPSDLADMFRALSVEGRLAGYEAQYRFFEIGSPDGLAELHQHLIAGSCDDHAHR